MHKAPHPLLRTLPTPHCAAPQRTQKTSAPISLYATDGVNPFILICRRCSGFAHTFRLTHKDYIQEMATTASRQTVNFPNTSVIKYFSHFLRRAVCSRKVAHAFLAKYNGGGLQVVKVCSACRLTTHQNKKIHN